MTGYQYGLYINQYGIEKCGLLGKVSFEEMIVLDMLARYSQLDWCTHIAHEGHTYHEFVWHIVPERLPMLRAKGKTQIKKYLRTLCNCGFLVAHPNNINGQSYFRFGEMYEAYIGARPPEEVANYVPDLEEPEQVEIQPEIPVQQAEPPPKRGKRTIRKEKKTPVEGWMARWQGIFNEVHIAGQAGEGATFIYDKKDTYFFCDIRKKIIALYQAKLKTEIPPDNDQCERAFKWLMGKAIRIPWLRDNLSPLNISRQFNTIVAKRPESTATQKIDPKVFENYFISKYGQP